MAKLVVLNKGSTGTAFELKPERNTVGRVDDNDVTIPEPSISGHHCEIYLKEGEVTVKDLGSTNGTFIDGNQTTEGVLKGGQILRLGKVEMRLEGVGEQQSGSRPASKGIQADKLEFGNRPVQQDTMFAQKSDKANKVFLTVGFGLGVIILALLLYAVFLSLQTSP